MKSDQVSPENALHKIGPDLCCLVKQEVNQLVIQIKSLTDFCQVLNYWNSIRYLLIYNNYPNICDSFWLRQIQQL